MKLDTCVTRPPSETNTACDIPHFEFRAPLEQDAEPIAQLFQIVYRESSHPCKEAAFVRATFHSGRDFWLVAVANGRVVACTAMQRQPWNGVFESCRSVTHPEFRCHGLGGLLYQRILDQVSRRPDFTYVFGFPRTRGMLRLLCADVELPFVILGHDGAMNVANGCREYHLVGMTTNNREPLRHVVSERGNVASAPFLQRQVLSRLGMIGEVGSYPSDLVVGPVGEQQAVVDGVVIEYRFDANLPNRALELMRVEAPGKDAGVVCCALETFLAQFPTVAHVSMNILSDKEELIGQLQHLGFEVSAYLPAWYVSGGRRYDCLMLIRQSFTEDPVAHETMELIQEFRQGLSDALAPDLAVAA